VTVTSGAEVHRRLSDPDLTDRVTRLGFRDQDVADLLTAIASVITSDDDLDAIATMAGRLVDRIGSFDRSEGQGDWAGPPTRTTDPAAGVLPMLALLATAPEVTAFHASRGIPADVSAATLADLGQQVWIHRLTYGEFGLHTYRWLSLAWSGALYWLGRLQFNLQLEPGEDESSPEPEWVLSTHIPRTGPLTPESVDSSFERAAPFFATHFPDFPTRDFFCRSWLLDPVLSELLPDSNLAAFQRRWRVYGEPRPGDADLLFFIFNRRPPVDLATLPTDTTLRRVAAEALRAGRSWSVFDGRLPQ
jgi:hypothetical protein